MSTKRDSLKRDTDLIVYSAGILKKVRAVAGSKSAKVRRFISREELAELASIHAGVKTGPIEGEPVFARGWFAYHGRQIVINRRANGQAVLFSL